MVTTRTPPKAVPPRRPGGRRPIPPLVFLLVLALLALVVWLKVLQKDETKQEVASAGCTATASAGYEQQLSNMANIKVKVLNGSGIKGLAAALQAELAKRGFTVVGIGNAQADNAVAGQILFGSQGAFAADVMSKHMVGFELVPDDTIKDPTIVVVPGEAYKGLADQAVAEKAVKPLIAAKVKTAGCASASS